MNDMEKPTFEESLREAFKGAEASPSENVWNNIELDLMKAESGKMRRRVLFYQLLAAASITFALLTIGVSLYVNAPNNNSQIASVEISNDKATGNATGENLSGIKSQDRINGSNSTDRLEKNNGEQIVSSEIDRSSNETTLSNKSRRATDLQGVDQTGDQTERLNESHRNILDQGEQVGNQAKAASTRVNPPGLTQPEHTQTETATRIAADRGSVASLSPELQNLPELHKSRNIQPQFNNKKPVESTADPGALLLAKLKDLENELAGKSTDSKKKKELSENLWTSVGFAAGGFNTTNPTVRSNSQAILAYSNTVNNQSKASGVSYSFGVSMGTRISERIVLQGGVNYLTQNSSYTSEQVVGSSDFQNFKAASLNDFRDASSGARVISTAPYSVNNNVEFFSVPMQARYVIINRKFALQLNAGVSTDFYLKNTIDPEGSGLEKTTQDRGADSPYRSLNFSGLMNTELSYRLSNRYRVSLNPGLRYPINSIYKDEIGIDATPLTFDVGLRFKYIFQ